MTTLHRVLVYGTLRPGFTGDNTVKVRGKLYDLGWYPGIRLGNDPDCTVTCEVIEVTDERLKSLDRYEGYDEDCPSCSLYLRSFIDEFNAWIYVYNNTMNNSELIESGDWLQHTKQKAGSNSVLAMEG